MEKKLNKRQEQAIETKRKLLSTSIDLIIKNGYNNVSVNKICKECNVAKGTFYLYFQSKKDIIIEILSDVNVEMFSYVWNQDAGCKERLHEYIDVYLYTIKRQGVDFTRETLKIMMDEQFNQQAVNATKHVELVEDILKKGIETAELNGNFQISDIRITLQNLFYGIMTNWCANEGKFDIEVVGGKLIKGYVDLLF